MKKKKQRTSKPIKRFVRNSTYERMQELQFHFPVQFLMLCKLVQVPPKTILHHFMQDLGRDSWQRHPDERMRILTADYFCLRATDRITIQKQTFGKCWPN